MKIPTTWWICAALVLGIAAVYWPVIGYPFTLFDDPDYVWLNSHVAGGLSWSGAAWAFSSFDVSNWHPVTWLSHMLDVQFFGMRAGWHHAVNVLFHAGNTVLLFLLLRRLSGALWRSAFVAALFGFHPLHVESVAWIAERKDVLSTFFFMLTLGAYVRYAQKRDLPLDPRRSTLDYSLALFFFTLGLMSKPMLVTLPFVLLLLDYWPLRRLKFLTPGSGELAPGSAPAAQMTLFGLLFEKVPFFLLSAASCVVTFLAQARAGALRADDILPFGLRLENALVAYVVYMKQMVWPTSLAVYYPYRPIEADSVATAILVLLVISGAAIFFFRRCPYLAVGWLWYLGTLVPVIGLVQAGVQALADRYTYVPLIGLFITITWGVGDILSGWRYHRAATAIASVAVLAICLRLTAIQVRWWQDTETLARHALAVTPDDGNMQILLGNALIVEGRFEEADRHFTDAVRIRPNDFQAQSGLALALADEGKIDEAIAAYRKAIVINPHEAKPHYMLAGLLYQRRNFTEAMVEYQLALQIDPNQPLALNDLAWILATAPDARLRNGAAAVDLAQRACRLTNYKMTLFVGTLAAAYAEAGRYQDAVKAAEQAITLAMAEKKGSLADKNRELLEIYRAKKAYHEPASH